jgi:Uma2 family endonuclease
MDVQFKRWTREQYDALVRAGVLGEDVHVQLVEGEIVEMAPQGPAHVTVIRLVEDRLRAAFGAGFDVRSQGPLALSDVSEPEPDVAVVRGSPRDHAREHPATAVLVVEVADTTVDFDRTRKGPMYARAGIPEYWIVDLHASAVEVYRYPGTAPDGRASYRTYLRVSRDGEISPLAAPGTVIIVRDLLP